MAAGKCAMPRAGLGGGKNLRTFTARRILLRTTGGLSGGSQQFVKFLSRTGGIWDRSGVSEWGSRAGRARAGRLIDAEFRCGQECPQRTLTHEILLSGFQQTLLGFFLALDAMASPGNGVEPLGVDLFAAGNALPEAAFADARESAIDHVEQLPVVIALAEKKFLIVGTGGAVGD